MFNSIRARLTLRYLLGFGSLLAGFSAYIYTSLAWDLAHEFDIGLLRTAQSVSDYFAEFVERNNLAAGARETVNELQLSAWARRFSATGSCWLRAIRIPRRR